MVTNTFVTKLTEEYNKCHEFIDHSVIKPLRFENDVVPTHQILSPLFKDDVPDVITEMLKTHCLSHFLQGHNWSKCESTKP